MAGKRNPRYSRAIGEPPHVGRRYVRDGKVRIEWSDGGKRRSKTVGPNSPTNRAKGDELLQEILTTMTDEHTDTAEDTTEEREESSESTGVQFEFPQSIRDAALRIMDAADDVADWLEDGISKVWSRSTGDDVEEGVVEEIQEDEESEDD
jgi:hypothetical protein